MQHKIITLFLMLCIYFSLSLHTTSAPSPLLETVIRFDPATVELGPSYCVGENFTIKARIENVEDLCGFVLKIGWNTSYLDYVNHIVKVPVETYPDGVIHEPSWIAADIVNVTEGWYLCDAGLFGYGPSFNGSGTAFEITFNVTQQPEAFEDDVFFRIKFTDHFLSPSTAGSIAHSINHCNVTIHPYWNPADVNDDLKVDIFDVLICANAYLATPSDPEWNPRCDLANPYDLISIFDIMTIVGSFGEEYQ